MVTEKYLDWDFPRDQVHQCTCDLSSSASQNVYTHTHTHAYQPEIINAWKLKTGSIERVHYLTNDVLSKHIKTLQILTGLLY